MKTTTKYHYFLIIGLLLSVLNTAAQQTDYRFTHLTKEDGLADNWVHNALMDSRGFMWFATNDALSRFDGQTFKTFRNDPQDSTSIIGYNIMDLAEAEDGSLWIATIGGGLNHFDPQTESFQSYRYPIVNNFIERNSAVCLLLDRDSILWLGTYDSGLHRFDQRNKTFERIDLTDQIRDHAEAFRKNSIHKIIQDIHEPDRLWLAANNGLYRFHKKERSLRYFPFFIDGQKDTLTAALSLYMTPQRPNEIWVGTWGLGLARFDIQKEKWQFFIPSPEDKRLQNYFSNIVDDIAYKGPDELWICSQAQGLMVFDLSQYAFRYIRHDPSDPYSILTNKFNGVYADPQKRLWFFNYLEGLSILDPANQNYQFFEVPTEQLCEDVTDAEVVDFAVDTTRQYIYLTTSGCEGFFVKNQNGEDVFSSPLNPRLPASIDRFHLHLDSDGLVWIAGGSLHSNLPSLMNFHPDKKELKVFDHPDLSTVPLHRMKLTCITEDENQNLWLGSMFSGLIKIDRKSGRLHQYIQSAEQPNAIHPQLHISSIRVGQDQRIWLSTLEDGIYVFDPKTEEFRHYPAGENGLIDKRIMSLEVAADGLIWIGNSDHGIQVVDPTMDTNKPIQTYRLAEGLPNEKINKIIRDKNGQLWIGSLQGLSRFDAKHQRFDHFAKKEGIKDPIFSGKGLSACQDGFIYIGQKNGYYRFSPDSLSKNQEPPALAFTYFNIFEKPTKFEQNLNFLSTIELDYQQNFFTIGFAALNFTQAEKNSYAYKLEGYDADWIYPMDNRNFATYTKVPPGDYTFKVKAANNEYIWTEEDIQLNLHISSPPWQSWWAYLLYALTIGSSLYFFYRFNLNRKLEQQEAKRVKELNQLKTKLYNNITHEFRTPITLILGFIDRAMQSRRPLQEEELEMMKSNSHQLLQLINQMLDLGKVDAGRMEIKRVQANITEFLQYLTNSFKSLALQKEIVLSFQSPQEPIAGAIDKEKLLIILSNLLSNALKFTARQGHISLNLQATGGPNPFYCIQIKDTGSGIAPEELPNIFDRFYQSKDEAPRPAGTGIGLSLVKELVDLLDGRIKVESEVGKGTQFTIELPLLQQAEPAEQPAQKSAISVPVLSSTENSIQQSAAPGLEAVHEQKPLLLLVEDHPDLIQYIAAGLEASYRLAFAQDGLTGLQKTFELMPDLIVSDVMMPELDGLSMCQQLKQDARSSHIPIVLLTARSGQASKLEGLKEGADVYLTKPFHDEELRLHIRNLLEQQKRSHNYFRQQAGLPSSDVANKQSDFPSKESVFLQELKQMVHDKLDDPNMNVATLSKLMGLSHTQLHRKLVALTGLPPVKYIRSLRLEQAKLLLKDPSKNISDVAYATGFSDPAYFSRIFKKETGQAPSAYRGFGDR